MRIKRKEEASMFRAHGGGVHTQDARIANSEEDISCKKYESICTSVCVSPSSLSISAGVIVSVTLYSHGMNMFCVRVCVCTRKRARGRERVFLHL